MRPLAWFFILTLAVLLAGCGKKQASFGDAASLAAAFDAAMSKGDLAAAADLFAIELWCKQNSTDWEMYAPQQRTEIIQKTTKDKATELGGLGYVAGGYTIAAPQPVQGGQLVRLIPKQGGAGLVLNCIQTDKGYLIFSVSSG